MPAFPIAEESHSHGTTDAFFFFICSVGSVMHKYMEKMGEVTFDKIFNQRLGEWLIYTLTRVTSLPSIFSDGGYALWTM